MAPDVVLPWLRGSRVLCHLGGRPVAGTDPPAAGSFRAAARPGTVLLSGQALKVAAGGLVSWLGPAYV